MIKLIRQAAVLIMTLFLQWPIFGLLAALRPLKLFQYLFLVYPGTDSDIEGYVPVRLGKSFIYRRRPILVGIISNNQGGGRGLVLAVPNTTGDFSRNEQTRKDVIARLEWYRKIVGADAIALAGQLPSVISKQRGPLNRPFVRGGKGTVFCVLETVSEVMKKHGLSHDHAKIAIVGVGHVGGLLLAALKKDGFNVTGIDIEKRNNSVVLESGGEVLLKCADIVIVLTPRGTDFLPYLKFLKQEAIIIDDTHPKIKEKDQPAGMDFYKVAVGIGNSRFYPRLPGYRPDWIPGCAIEAMVASATGDFNGMPQNDFNRTAKEMGFFAHMVK